MATLVVGDVHGMLGPLRRMMRHAAGEKLVLVGDLVGRGSDSLGVLRALADLGDRVETVLGNHDLHLLWLLATGAAKPHHPHMASILEAADCDELCGWLRNQRLAMAVPESGALIVHAGIWYGWDESKTLELAGEVEVLLRSSKWQEALREMYGSSELGWDGNLRAGRRAQAIVNLLTRMRVCDSSGAMLNCFRGMPGEQMPPHACAWFDMPQRRTKKNLVVCGHWSGLGLVLRPDLAMLDSGCCFGGPLSGLWLEDRRLVCESQRG